MRKRSSVIRKKFNIANISGINSFSSYKHNCTGFFWDWDLYPECPLKPGTIPMRTHSSPCRRCRASTRRSCSDPLLHHCGCASRMDNNPHENVGKLLFWAHTDPCHVELFMQTTKASILFCKVWGSQRTLSSGRRECLWDRWAERLRC